MEFVNVAHSDLEYWTGDVRIGTGVGVRCCCEDLMHLLKRVINQFNVNGHVGWCRGEIVPWW